MNRVGLCLPAGEAVLPEVQSACEPPSCGRDKGLTLIETLIATTILGFGLLATAQLVYAAMASASLARTKVSATVAAEDKLEFLGDVYRQNPAAADLAPGDHGPQPVKVVNPVDGTTLNRFSISWFVRPVPDPRPGKILPAMLVEVTIVPADAEGNPNRKMSLNKVVNVTAIFSAVTR